MLLAEKHLRLTGNVLLCHPNAFIHQENTNFLMHLIYCIYKVVHVSFFSCDFLRPEIPFFPHSCRREEKLNYTTLLLDIFVTTESNSRRYVAQLRIHV